MVFLFVASEVGNLKEQLELRPSKWSSGGDATLGASKITQLNNQVKFYQTREEEYKLQILQLENEVSSLKSKLTAHERSKNINAKEEGEKYCLQYLFYHFIEYKDTSKTKNFRCVL